MQKLALDFVRNPPPARLAMLLLLSGLILAAFIATQYWQAKQQTMLLSQQLVALQAQQPTVKTSARKSPTRQQEADRRRLQAITVILSSPWSPLFAALESSASDDVALLAIQPDASKHQLRITAEARDYAAMLGYLQRLEKLPQLQGIHLLQHAIKVDEQKQPVRFTIAADWSWQA